MSFNLKFIDMVKFIFCLLFSSGLFSQSLTFKDLINLGVDIENLDTNLSAKGFELESTNKGVTYVLNSAIDKNKEFINFDIVLDKPTICYTIFNIDSYNRLIEIIKSSDLKLIDSDYNSDNSYNALYRNSTTDIFIYKGKMFVSGRDLYFYTFTLAPNNQ